MSEFLKAQQELRASLITEVQSRIDEAEERGGLDAETREAIDKLEADIAKADEAINVFKRQEERKLEVEAAAKGFEVVEATKSEADTLRALAINSGSEVFEARALSSSTDTVPQTFFDQVMNIARSTGPMLDVSRVFNTQTGEKVTYPVLTAYATANAEAEGAQLDEEDPTYSSIELDSYKIGGITLLSEELVTDAGFDILEHVAEAAGNSLGFKANALLTNGTGTVQPTGFMNSAATGVTGGTGVDGAFTADDLIDLAYSLDSAARRLPGVAWMANAATVGAIRKLKDDDGRYIYNPTGSADADTLLGYPIIENPHMPDIAAETGSVAFGHWPSFYTRIAGGLRLDTSRDFKFGNDQVAFRFLMRFDGGLTIADHIKLFVGGAA
jgi:HK97 family phage major capsid protein